MIVIEAAGRSPAAFLFPSTWPKVIYENEERVAIKALMVDVDGVVIDGRPEDGRSWHTSLQEDLGFSRASLDEHFFAPHWDNVIVGRAGLMEQLTTALPKIAPHLAPEKFISYWFERDSRLVAPLLAELSSIRAEGIRVYLATNQEHLRATYLMETLDLAQHVDGIFYSARLGVRKPDPQFFAKVQAAVALRGEEILFIDDLRENIEGALKAGWQALHWTKGTAPGVVRQFCN